MSKKFGRIAGLVLITLLIATQPFTSVLACENRPGGGFVKRIGPRLWLNGRPFRFAGTNNYYPMYKSQFMVDDVLQRAADNDFRVFRMWSSIDIGYNDDDWTHSLHRNDGNVYFHYLDPATNEPAFNDGEDGLAHMDYIIWRAGELGLKLVLPSTNNWQDFGGMDQYVKWRELQLGEEAGEMYHSDFYTDPVIKQWYKDWISHLLNHVNPLTGLAYKDDPTIMTWELGNEPRCKGSGLYPSSPDCTTDTLIGWADEMSGYIKSIDRKHLVSAGDEGFYCIEGAEHWTENCGEGVDTIAFTKLRNIDVMSFHLYPDHWGMDAAWGTEWIARHIRDARRLRKPVMLGEYGWKDKATRNPVFKEWTDTVYFHGGTGALYWLLSGLETEDTLYPDYDGFTVYCPSPVCTTLGNLAGMMGSRAQWRKFPPVADHDVAITEFETPVTLDPAANDIAYGFHNAALAETIDLDLATGGQQTAVTVVGGTAALQTDGTVLFTPEAGFFGKVEIAYTIKDRWHRTSNEANLSVTVKPEPGVPIQLFSFETGIEGWAPASWEPTSAALTQSDVWATDGSYSLEIAPIDTGWVGVGFSPALDLSNGYTVIEIDLHTTPAAGTWFNIALQVGPDWTWCQGPGEWVPQDTTMVAPTPAMLDLLSLSCGEVDLSQVNTLMLYTNGLYYVDNIWAK
jgi:mannan endo-1,4-beta-mannosidase